MSNIERFGFIDGTYGAMDLITQDDGEYVYFDDYEKLFAQSDELLAALKVAAEFIDNGIEFGFIRMPDQDTPDSAHKTPQIIRDAIAKCEAQS